MYGRKTPPKELEGPKLAWDAGIVSSHPGAKSFQAPWIFGNADDGAQARRWVEYFVHALIGEEIPRSMLAGYVRQGIIERVEDRKQIRPDGITRTCRFASQEDGTLRWEDVPAESSLLS